MKRDLDLIRLIAQFFEQADVEWIDSDYGSLRKRGGRLVAGLLPDIDGYEDEDIRHAVSIMVDNGLLIEHGELHGPVVGKVSVVLARRLGWNGHEFLDAVRDQDVYERVVDIADQAKNWTVAFFIEAAKRYAFQQIGL